MDPKIITEMIGYIGSLLVVVSMLMSSVLKLRIINSIGSCIFAVYALIIQSYPTALMNFCLVAINIYNLAILIKRDDRHYHLAEGAADDTYLEYFINYHKDDIKNYFSEFNFVKDAKEIVYYICCGENVAGVLLGKRLEEDTIEISLEYSTPMYRDCSAGKYMYEKLPEKGIHTLIYSREAEAHGGYLQKMGYSQTKKGYVKNL